MEKILLVSLENYGNTFVEPKVELGARFGHLVCMSSPVVYSFAVQNTNSATPVRFLDIYQVTQALNTVLTNQKQLSEMRRSWEKIDFESVRNQSALVCNCRHEDLVQLLEVEFRSLMESLTKSAEPVRDVMAWADKCCERLMGGHGGPDDRSTMSSRSILIRWGYVTSQVMRDLVSLSWMIDVLLRLLTPSSQTIRSDPTFGAFQILKLFLECVNISRFVYNLPLTGINSDWIALNVLRNVALSTTSVAASVEPVMQQQFFTLSPMVGQENFGSNLDTRSQHHMMSHTPTTSSMLAALQQDSFSANSLDAAPFSHEAFGLPAFMDTTTPHDDHLGGVHTSLAFPDYVSGNNHTFDVAAFTPQDLGIGSAPGSSNGDHEQSELEGVKSEEGAA